MKKFLLFLLVFLFPMMTFAGNIITNKIPIDVLSCPTGTEYLICYGKNAELHNKIVTAFKKGDIKGVIKYWDNLSNLRDKDSWIEERLFGAYMQGSEPLLYPVEIKKEYKGGILFVSSAFHYDPHANNLLLGYMKYTKDGYITITTTPLAPEESPQYKTYEKIYAYKTGGQSIDGEIMGFNFQDFLSDVKKSF